MELTLIRISRKKPDPAVKKKPDMDLNQRVPDRGGVNPDLDLDVQRTGTGSDPRKITGPDLLRIRNPA